MRVRVCVWVLNKMDITQNLKVRKTLAFGFSWMSKKSEIYFSHTITILLLYTTILFNILKKRTRIVLVLFKAVTK